MSTTSDIASAEDKKTFLRGVRAGLACLGALVIIFATVGFIGFGDDKADTRTLMLGFSLGLGYYFSFTGIMDQKFHPTHVRLSIAVLISFLFPFFFLGLTPESWYTIDKAIDLAVSGVAFATAGFSAGTLLRHWLS